MSWTDVPICLDSEGAQIRNQKMESESVAFKKGTVVKIHQKSVVGDSQNISFTPKHVVEQMRVTEGHSVPTITNDAMFVAQAECFLTN